MLVKAGQEAEVATEAATYFISNKMMQISLMNQKAILFC